jgi:PhzF family phenazine biosynthesis protein
MPTRYGYLTVDVFTERAFSGNPVAVMLDAKGLSTDEMHRVAAEFNYSESTLPGRRRRRHCRRACSRP